MSAAGARTAFVLVKHLGNLHLSSFLVFAVFAAPKIAAGLRFRFAILKYRADHDFCNAQSFDLEFSAA